MGNAPAKSPRKQNSNGTVSADGGYRNAEIMLALFVRMLLTCLLGDIIIRKPYKSRKRKQRHYGYLPPLPLLRCTHR